MNTTNCNKRYEKTLIIPVPLEMWETLRRISFDERVSMSSVVRESLKKTFTKYKKTVDSQV